VDSCLHYASEAGFDPTSSISAVHIGFDKNHELVSSEEMDIQWLQSINEGTAEERLARVKAAYDIWLAHAAHPERVSWKNDIGDIEETTERELKSADLVVIGQPMHLDAIDALHAILFQTRKLVLITPPITANNGDRPIGKHMMIGWKTGEPARHAVEAAMPWLRRCETVTVVCVAKADADSYEVGARDLLDQLGIKANYLTIDRGETSVGLCLLAEAARIGADALVIGAYHHGQLWEAVFGGVTRDVIKHAELPVFLMR
jgi:hypothetical protein